MNLINKILQAVLEAALPILVSALAAWVIAKTAELCKKLKEKNPDIYASLYNIASVAVRSAEQLIGSKHGQEKKEYAKKVISKYLEARGIVLDLDLIEAAIESAVYNMNSYHYEIVEDPGFLQNEVTNDLPPAVQE
ncbi:MAG: phage holin [Lachnospiraceae bacterium]|nr:phage holin [Lachnospiraceae bacterium]